MSDRWRRVGALFEQALAAPAGSRDAVIDGSREEQSIKKEVRALLAAHDAAGDFLEGAVERHLDAASSGTSAASADELPAGTRRGAYRIDHVLGRGGMGIVYAAEDTRLRRRVALKALPSAAATDERRRSRLRQEARAAAALQHPGIATVYALEEIDGDLFIAAEYLEGETLRAELAGGPMSPADAVGTMEEIVRALCVAHEHGVVHRDLKPENVMRTREGTLKILDFGVATIESTTGDLVSRSQMTESSVAAGTPLYMAPEQLLGRAADSRVDHFAVGVMLFELATGRHPFGGESLPSTIARILAAPPDLSITTRDHDLPASLARLIARCLEKDPRDRFASTRELLDALRATATELATPQAAVGGPTPSHSRAPAPIEAHPVTATRAGPHLAASGATQPHAPAVRWWRFHQFAAAVLYWAMVWPSWHVHRSFERLGLTFFFATLAAVVIAATLRLHLWFSSRVYPEDLPAQRDHVSRWIWWADVGFAGLLLSGGIALPEQHSGWAALLISFAIGAAVAFTFIEPATARAAFRSWHRRE